MKNKEQIMNQLEKINKVAKLNGFIDLTFFKGFSFRDEKILQILIKDNEDSETYFNRFFQFSEDLKEIFGDNLHITNEKQMYDHYKKQLDSKNSIALSQLVEEKDQESSDLLKILKTISPDSAWKALSSNPHTAGIFSETGRKDSLTTEDSAEESSTESPNFEV